MKFFESVNELSINQFSSGHLIAHLTTTCDQDDIHGLYLKNNLGKEMNAINTKVSPQTTTRANTQIQMQCGVEAKKQQRRILPQNAYPRNTQQS